MAARDNASRGSLLRRDIRWHRAATYPSRNVPSFCAVYTREITIRRRIATLTRRLDSARKNFSMEKLHRGPRFAT